jgi:hypothetical protein
VDPTLGDASGETVLGLVGGDNGDVISLVYILDSPPTDIDETDSWTLTVWIEDSADISPPVEYSHTYTSVPASLELDLLQINSLGDVDMSEGYYVKVISQPLGDAYDPGGNLIAHLAWD